MLTSSSNSNLRYSLR